MPSDAIPNVHYNDVTIKASVTTDRARFYGLVLGRILIFKNHAGHTSASLYI